ncbi:uncharacterized protein LY89DRAFT_762858 [Mollisia scopiformis]|uniref:Ubiquitin-like domain-containing protein n=1 Tax=Mollisia scopiformis TaxID=149040 RepID=A0A194XQY3_MOLSC|nr:uncharacterized protein LY89DRAFT_762858 [Mollisia scopiformis]KUJ22561.1 hypothetical protein LY89DRAFT_762858 [Mollisia scopiformis]
MSCGFSAGDFIEALKLVVAITDAIRATGRAQTQYHEFLYQLEAYKDALEAIQSLYNDGEEPSLILVNLSRHALDSMQLLAEQFRKLQKYSRSLGKGTKAKNRFMSMSIMKIRWAFFEMEAVERCQKNLKARVDIIKMLLSAYHMDRNAAESRRQNEQYQSLGRAIGEDVNEVHHLQLLLYQEVKEVMRAIPNQVLRQQPISFCARGRTWPISLELVQSTKEFITVLKMKFENVWDGRAVRKIEAGDFLLYLLSEDGKTTQSIDLRNPWESLFQPGQRVNMYMHVARALLPILCKDCGALCTQWTFLWSSHIYW